jgi:hypothetical protein
MKELLSTIGLCALCWMIYLFIAVIGAGDD